jgi:hypothetical protein
MFRTNFKKFYGVFRKRNSNVKNTPIKEEAEKFRKELFGKNDKDIIVLLPIQLITVNKFVKTVALLI